MPVGTQGTVKAVTPRQLREIGAQVILGNTYHLRLRPGHDLIDHFGGLHPFMAWDRPILTDSGGFQAFSLAAQRTLTDQGVAFKSHLDGSPFFLGPQECYEIQRGLRSDIAMVLDECPPWPCERDAAAVANQRTHRWAQEFLDIATDDGFLERGHLVFAIAQGSTFDNLRAESAQGLASLDFPGYAIGGVSVGEPEEEMLRQVAAAAPHLPETKSRYVMGVGTPPQLLKMISLGCDLFDCVMPTRLARHGTVFTPHGTLNLRNARFARDPRPIVDGLANETCQHFSRAYLRHLIIAEELLACTLLSVHNLHFFLDLMEQARQHLAEGTFTPWSRQWIATYEAGESAQS